MGEGVVYQYDMALTSEVEPKNVFLIPKADSHTRWKVPAFMGSRFWCFCNQKAGSSSTLAHSSVYGIPFLMCCTPRWAPMNDAVFDVWLPWAGPATSKTDFGAGPLWCMKAGAGKPMCSSHESEGVPTPAANYYQAGHIQRCAINCNTAFCDNKPALPCDHISSPPRCTGSCQPNSFLDTLVDDYERTGFKR